MLYRIALKSNFNDEMFKESWFTNFNYYNESEAKAVADAHNSRKEAAHARSFAVVVPSDYVLYEFQP